MRKTLIFACFLYLISGQIVSAKDEASASSRMNPFGRLRSFGERLSVEFLSGPPRVEKQLELAEKRLEAAKKLHASRQFDQSAKLAARGGIYLLESFNYVLDNNMSNKLDLLNRQLSMANEFRNDLVLLEKNMPSQDRDEIQEQNASIVLLTQQIKQKQLEILSDR